jgi:hypothetical protein
MFRTPMIRTKVVLLAICCGAPDGFSQAADGPEVIAAGEWSKPVADARGYAVRGRLVICQKARGDNRRETPVYVELQDASDFIGASMRIFCDMGKHDFRPDYKGGLQCEMRDKNEKPVESTSFPFGGATPKSEWVTLPTDATIRLRATPFGIHREKALSLCPHLGKLWVIGDDDLQEYFLSGTFTVDPADEPGEPGGDHIWRGKIDLPAVRIATQRK